MDRRTFIGSVAGGLLAEPLCAAAQQPAKVPVVIGHSPRLGRQAKCGP